MTPEVSINTINPSSSTKIQDQLKSSTQEYQSLRTQLNKLIIKNQNLESQLTQNRSIKHDFDLIPTTQVQPQSVHKPNDTKKSTPTTAIDPKCFVIYKSIGNVLIKQDLQESKSNVNRRIEFLTEQISRLEPQISSIQTKMSKTKSTINDLQNQLVLSKPPSNQPPTQQLSKTHLG